MAEGFVTQQWPGEGALDEDLNQLLAGGEKELSLKKNEVERDREKKRGKDRESEREKQREHNRDICVAQIAIKQELETDLKKFVNAHL